MKPRGQYLAVVARRPWGVAGWGAGWPKSGGHVVAGGKVRPGAFSLIEVLIALSVFCIVAFAVLQLLITGLGTARSLQIRHADVAVLAAELATTNNILEEGVESGDFGEFYPHARWERNVQEVGSNGLFQVDFVVFEKVGKNEVSSDMSILLYRPGSPKGKMSGGTGRASGPMPLQ